MGMHESLAQSHPSIARGQVWCRSCGGTRKVNPADCLRDGWPKCCGYTMTVDGPEEQRRLSEGKTDRNSKEVTK